MKFTNKELFGFSPVTINGHKNLISKLKGRDGDKKLVTAGKNFLGNQQKMLLLIQSKVTTCKWRHKLGVYLFKNYKKIVVSCYREERLSQRSKNILERKKETMKNNKSCIVTCVYKQSTVFELVCLWGPTRTSKN